MTLMRHPYTIDFLLNLLTYFNGTPPTYNPVYDINADGSHIVIDVAIGEYGKL